MSRFEWLCVLLHPFEHPLHQRVRRTLQFLARRFDRTSRQLDVGGRRSNYTINVPLQVWITDVPREKALQHALDLGATDAIRDAVLGRRTNVVSYTYDDMTRTSLPSSHFSVVSAIEVLEHVDEDELFVRNVAKVLVPGGYFLMTTPNGDFLPKPYPDHRRHYRAEQLATLLRRHFASVSVDYFVNRTRLFSFGLHRPSTTSPIRSLLGMLAFGLASILDRLGYGGKGPDRKLHLFAVCKK